MKFDYKIKDRLPEVKMVNRVSSKSSANGVELECFGIEAPDSWSQSAVDIFASKYCRQINETRERENSVLMVVKRIVDKICSFGFDHKYFDSKEDLNSFKEDLTSILLNQVASFNSPVWFNVGMDSYGQNSSSSGHFAWNFEKNAAEPTADSYGRPQGSACFIISIRDSLDSIFEHAKTESRLFRYGSGCGTNYSPLRGKGEPLSNGGVSSGLISFLRVFDTGAGAVKSAGTTRRAAKMDIVNDDHPDVLEFISWKQNEERKAQALIDAGYDSHYEGEAYMTVSGQNSNNSVSVTDRFMRAVEGGKNWNLINRVSGSVSKTLPARQIWEAITESAWQCGDPGIQFTDTINSMHTCALSGRINASNPCSEFVFLDNSACNLASINLVKFLDQKGEFDFELFRYVVRILIVAQDILVDLSSYPTKEICENSHRFRPLGLGYANLGGLLMRMAIPYDSDEARDIAAKITAVMHAKALSVSCDLAKSLGTSEEMLQNKSYMLGVLYRHRDIMIGIHGNKRWYSSPFLSIELTIERTKLHGIRNAQVTLLAPTGTIGLAMDCDTLGIEPDFALVKHKKLAGGGSMQIVNRSVRASLKRIGLEDEKIKEVENFILVNGHAHGAPHLTPENAFVFDTASGPYAIRPMAHLEMMAAVQPFLSGAISKTVNLPNSATQKDISDVYFAAWKMELKSVAVYRDGCKQSQPLNAQTPKGEEKSKNDTRNSGDDSGSPNNADSDSVPHAMTERRLPYRRKGFTQEAKIGGQKLFLRTGEFGDGSLGEIFLDMHKQGSTLGSVVDCFAIAVSLGLQHGVPLQKFVNMFVGTRFEPSGVVERHETIKFASSIMDYVFRALGSEYLGLDYLTHTNQPSSTNQSASIPRQESGVSLSSVVDTCVECGAAVRRSGSCGVCDNGHSTGCS